MRAFVYAMLLLAYHPLCHADLAADLRQLRNTISETAKTSKALDNFTVSGEDSKHSRSTDNTVSTEQEIKEGDILVAKISSIKLFKAPSKTSIAIATLSKQDEMIYTGNQVEGFYAVATSGKDDGWVEKILVKKTLPIETHPH